ncbi:MAG: hypothetical protein NTW58_09800 [Actinobacteria bacterium]|nr:hypothetical protein [Actinomycetota bacterium]
MGTPAPPEKDSHPNRGTLGQPPMGGGDHLYLSADQLQDHDGKPSWKAPREKRSLTNASLIVIILLVAAVTLIALRVAGVI